MLDDLRKSTLENDDFDDADEQLDDVFVPEEKAAAPRRFLGMTAVERMFLSIFFFMNVLVLGLALLIATQRIVL